MSEPICGRSWRAPRVDVPTSVDVNHVCALAADHDGLCVCSCDAEVTLDELLARAHDAMVAYVEACRSTGVELGPATIALMRGLGFNDWEGDGGV